MDAHELARNAANAALDKKAEDITIFDLRETSSIADFFVICTGHTDIHVKAIYKEVREQLLEMGARPFHKEGVPQGRWILLDYSDVIIHIFQPEVREFYGLERLWGDAESEVIKDEEVEA